MEDRRALKLEIVRSQQRSGEVEATADRRAAGRAALRRPCAAAELPAGERDAATALWSPTSSWQEGLGEEAIARMTRRWPASSTRRSAGTLTMQRGHALFRLRRYAEARRAFREPGARSGGALLVRALLRARG